MRLIALGIGLLIGVPSLYAPWVKGHFRNGTYVSGHWRTEPNEYKYDNLSFDDWDSPYLTDWYNKSYFDKHYGKGYYERLKQQENYSKQFDEDYTWIRGYTKGNGTYVKGYWKRKPKITRLREYTNIKPKHVIIIQSKNPRKSEYKVTTYKYGSESLERENYPSNSGEVSPRTKLYTIQVGAFRNKENAKKRLNQLSELGYYGFIKEEEGYFKVRLNFFNQEEASFALKALKEKRIEGFRVKK